MRIYFNMMSDLGLKLFQEFTYDLRNKMHLRSNLNVPNMTFQISSLLRRLLSGSTCRCVLSLVLGSFCEALVAFVDLNVLRTLCWTHKKLLSLPVALGDVSFSFSSFPHAQLKTTHTHWCSKLFSAR